MIIFAHEKKTNLITLPQKPLQNSLMPNLLILPLPPRVGLKGNLYSLTLETFSWLILSTWSTIQTMFLEEVTFVVQLTCYLKNQCIWSDKNA